MSKLGIEAVVYRNTGSYGSPTWSEVTRISDFTPNEKWDVAEIMIRLARVKFGAKTTLDIGFTGKLLRDDDDANYLAFVDAARSPDDVVDLLILDGPNDVVGSIGVRADYQITDNTGSQNPGDVLYMDLNGVPYPTANSPSFAEVEAGPTITYTAI